MLIWFEIHFKLVSSKFQKLKYVSSFEVEKIQRCIHSLKQQMIHNGTLIQMSAAQELKIRDLELKLTKCKDLLHKAELRCSRLQEMISQLQSYNIQCRSCTKFAERLFTFQMIQPKSTTK